MRVTCDKRVKHKDSASFHNYYLFTFITNRCKVHPVSTPPRTHNIIRHSCIQLTAGSRLLSFCLWLLLWLNRLATIGTFVIVTMSLCALKNSMMSEYKICLLQALALNSYNLLKISVASTFPITQNEFLSIFRLLQALHVRI